VRDLEPFNQRRVLFELFLDLILLLLGSFLFAQPDLCVIRIELVFRELVLVKFSQQNQRFDIVLFEHFESMVGKYFELDEQDPSDVEDEEYSGEGNHKLEGDGEFIGISLSFAVPEHPG